MNNTRGTSMLSMGTSMLWSLFKIKYVSDVDKFKISNPLLRVYFDSDLGSPVEQRIEEAYAASSYAFLKTRLPKGKVTEKIAKSLGIFIGRATAKVLDISKLNYKYFKRQIEWNEYKSELSKRVCVTTATIIDKGWMFVAKGIKTTGSVLLAPFIGPDTAKSVAETVTTFMTFAKPSIIKAIKSKRAEIFVSKAIQTISTGINVIVNAGSKVTESSINFIKEFAKKTETTFEKITEFAKKSCTTIGDSAKKIVGKICNMLRK